MSNNNILLCDIGGTHVRFAKHESKGEYSNFKKYTLNDFSSFDDIIQHYMDETNLSFSCARLSTALVPQDGQLSYQRFDGEQNFKINFEDLKQRFKWNDLSHFMDLEAAGNALPIMTERDFTNIIPPKTSPINDKKILISVGTGLAHALVDNQTITRYTDGHILPLTVTDEHRTVEAYIRKRKNVELCLIMEDFISGRGLRMMATALNGDAVENLSPDALTQYLQETPNVVRVFFEFLGLYTHNAVTVSGFYGGVYFTGGVIDALMANDLTNWESFYKYYCPSMLPVVQNRLQRTGFYYIHEGELPLLGLTNI